MKVISVNSAQVTLVRHDEIPLNKVGIKRNADQLQHIFGFQNIQVAGLETGEVAYFRGTAGSIRVEETDYPIMQLKIEERRIILRVGGNTNIANTSYEKLKQFLVKLVDIEPEVFMKPIVIANESEIITQLDFHINEMFDSRFIGFINGELNEVASSELAKTFANLMYLEFEIRYQPENESLMEHNISLAPKSFKIEPRKGTPHKDRMYYCMAPLDTESHIELLKQLEKTFSSS